MSVPKLTPEEFEAAINIKEGYQKILTSWGLQAHEELWDTIRQLDEQVDLEAKKVEPDRRLLDECEKLKEKALQALGISNLQTLRKTCE